MREERLRTYVINVLVRMCVYIQIYKYTHTSAHIHKYKYTNTNTQKQYTVLGKKLGGQW